MPSLPKSLADLTTSQFRLTTIILLNDILLHENDATSEVFDAFVHNEDNAHDDADTPSMSNIFRLSEEVVARLKQLGYRNKLTFRDLMHPGEQVMRDLFRWLNERMATYEASTTTSTAQRTASGGTDETGAEQLRRSIRGAVQKWRNEWVMPRGEFAQQLNHEHSPYGVPASTECAASPTILRFSNVQHVRSLLNACTHDAVLSTMAHNRADIQAQSRDEEEWENETGGLVSRHEFIEQKQERIRGAVKDILVRDIERDAQRSVKSLDELLQQQQASTSNTLSALRDKFKSSFENKKFFELDEEWIGAGSSKPIQETEEQILERRQKDETEAQEALDKLINMMKKLQDQSESLAQSETQLLASTQEQKTQKKKLQEQYKITAQTFNLFKDKDNSLPEMQKISSQSAQKLIDLAQEWETHRVPLLDRYNQLQQELHDRKQSYKNTVDALKQSRNNIRSSIQEVKEKEQATQTLKQNYESLPKNLTRQEFVTRIFDIVKNIESQRKEIAKILAESRELRRAIEKISEQLSGTFREAEKNIFEVAQRDPVIADVYENLLQLRGLFESIVKTVNDKGQFTTTMRDLDLQIDVISKRNNENNLEQASADLEMIKKENLTLIREVKKRKAMLQEASQ